MIDRLLGIVAPHHCCGCAKVGTILCDGCKYDIEESPFEGCIMCGRPSSSGICKPCRQPYERAWVVGYRHDTLEQLISRYKFSRVQQAAILTGRLVAASLPELPPEVIVTTVPTNRAHIRQRGYDHAELIAREVARERAASIEQPLRRLTSTVQLGASRTQRWEQAEYAYAVTAEGVRNATYLLVDDVFTTGATVHHASRCLLEAGAAAVWVAIAARQPLDS